MTRTIILTRTEQQLAQYVAKQRHIYNRENNIEDGKIGPQSEYITDLNGIGGELAFCKLVNIYPDITTDQGQPAFDCKIANKKIDVKTTTWNTGHLLVKQDVKSKCDFYVLMIGTFPHYRYAGWASAREVFNNNNLKDFGYGVTHALRQSELHHSMPKKG